jgi:CHAT domain-containing protein/tetratricopeptide (TPR) repeat protein
VPTPNSPHPTIVRLASLIDAADRNPSPQSANAVLGAAWDVMDSSDVTEQARAEAAMISARLQLPNLLPPTDAPTAQELVAIVERALACSLAPDGPSYGWLVRSLGPLVMQGLQGDQAHRRRCAVLLDQALDRAPAGTCHRGLLRHIAALTLTSVPSARSAEDEQLALRLWRQGLRELAADSPLRPELLDGIVRTHQARHASSGDPAELVQAREAQREALAATPTYSKRLSPRYSLLGSLTEQCGAGSRESKREALALYHQAIRASRNQQETYVAAASAFALEREAALSSCAPEVTIAAIEHGRIALELSGADQNVVESTALHLAQVFKLRSDQTGQIAFLDQAIALGARSVDPEHLGYLRDRYFLSGDPADIDRTIDATATFLQSLPAGHQHATAARCVAATARLDRFRVTGSDTDLFEALQTMSMAESELKDSDDQLVISNNKAATLSLLFQRTGRVGFSDASILILREVLSWLPESHAQWSGVAASLGGGLAMRARQYTHSRSDLEEARSTLERAIERENNVVYRHRFRQMLINVLMDSVDHGADEVLLETALEFSRSMVDELPENSPDHTIALTTLASVLMITGTRNEGRRAEADGIIESQLANMVHLPAESRLTIQIARARGFALAADWPRAAATWSMVLDLLERQFAAQRTGAGREYWLRASPEAAVEACYAHSKLGDLSRALALFTEGRDRAESARRRRRDRLSADILDRQPELAAEFDLCASKLAILEENTSFSDLVRVPASRLRVIVSELARGHRHFEELSTQLEQLTATSAGDPSVGGVDEDTAEATVLLLAAEQGGLALIVGRDDSPPTPIWLDRLTQRMVHEMLVGRRGEPNQLAWLDVLSSGSEALRNVVVESTCTNLATLGVSDLIAELRDQGICRARLVASGLISNLPLHAVSHVPTGQRWCETTLFCNARSLRTRNGGSSRLAPNSRVVVINQPWPVAAARRLPAAAAEAAAVSARLANVTEIPGAEATPVHVLEALRTADVAHFCCHGSSSVSLPEQSGLLLANDAVLTIGQLARLGRRKRSLAFLSACESGVVGLALPEELIGLPAAFHAAGFKWVISALWPIGDLAATVFSLAFYQRLGKPDSTIPESFHGARSWLRTATVERAEDLVRETVECAPDKIDSYRVVIRALELNDPRDQIFSPVLRWAALTLSEA